MPRKTKTTAAADKAAQPQFSAELLEQLIPGPVTPAELEGIFQQFKKAVLERALGAEMSHHLGYAPGQAKPEGAAANHRNGKSTKTVLTDTGALRIDVPRDREGTFEPQLIGKHERRFTGFDDKIVAMYARGMTVREIQGFLAEMYSVDVSPDLISSVTDAVMSEVTAWQSRPLEAMYPVVFFDALRVKIREDAVVRSKAVYLALGVLPDGSRDILGIWIENTEGAKFWMEINTLDDLQHQRSLALGRPALDLFVHQRTHGVLFSTVTPEQVFTGSIQHGPTLTRYLPVGRLRKYLRYISSA